MSFGKARKIFIYISGVRVTNLFVPILYKDIVDALVETELRPSTWPWQYVTIWAVLRLLQGGGTGSSGLLNNWRSLLWIRVQQYTTLEIQTNLLAHVHNLSLRYASLFTYIFFKNHMSIGFNIYFLNYTFL